MNPRFSLLIFTFLFLAAITTHSGYAQQTESPVPLKPDVTPIDNYLKSCEAFGWSGVVLVAHKREIEFCNGYGQADQDTHRKNDGDTLFEIASVTKVFTATAIMKLVQQGVLKLDDSISSHLPGVPVDKSDITIRHLLTHTSGMSRNNAGGGSSVDQAVNSYLSNPLTRKPGSGHEYWNGGYALLAALIEHVTKQSVQEFTHSEIFLPAGMGSSGFTGNTKLPERQQAYGYSGKKLLRGALDHPYQEFGFNYKGMGGIVTTARDLLRFVQALEDGLILEGDSFREMQKTTVEHQGIGWQVVDSKRNTPRVLHGGDVRGFHSSLEYLPVEECVIVVLSNADDIPRWKIQWNVQSLLFGEEPRYPLPPKTVSLDDELAEKLAGRYSRADSADDCLVVERSGNGMVISADGMKASTLLSGSSSAERSQVAAKQAESVFNAIHSGDEEFIRELLPNGVFWARTWPVVLVDQIWPKKVRELGPFLKYETVGVSVDARGLQRVVIRLLHDNGICHMQADFSRDNELVRLVFDGSPYAVSQHYLPAENGDFSSFDWHHDSGLPAIRFVTDDDTVHLVVQTSDGSSTTFRREQ